MGVSPWWWRLSMKLPVPHLCWPFYSPRDPFVQGATWDMQKYHSSPGPPPCRPCRAWHTSHLRGGITATVAWMRPGWLSCVWRSMFDRPPTMRDKRRLPDPWQRGCWTISPCGTTCRKPGVLDNASTVCYFSGFCHVFQLLKISGL